MFSPLRRTDPDFFEFEWRDVIVGAWTAGRAQALLDVVRPTVPMGFYAECTTAGMAAASEPRWPTTAGATVTDGSVVWTMRAPSSVTLPTITAHTYVITPAGITQSSPTISGSQTSTKLDAVNADLGLYTVHAEITAGGEDYSLEEQLVVIA
jgi:hypothetical protein